MKKPAEVRAVIEIGGVGGADGDVDVDTTGPAVVREACLCRSEVGPRAFRPG